MRVLALREEEPVHCGFYAMVRKELGWILSRQRAYREWRARQAGCRALVSGCGFPSHQVWFGGRVQNPSRCFLERFVCPFPYPLRRPCLEGSVWVIAHLVSRQPRSWRWMLVTHRQNACV